MIRRRGYSLLEVVVACAVGGLVLAAVARLMVHGGQMYLRGSTRADLQAAGLVAVSRIDRALREAAPTLTSVQPAAAALACRGPADARFFVVFRDPGRRALVQKWWPRLEPGGGLADAETFRQVAALSEARALTQAELQDVCATANGTERVIAGDVTEVTVTLAAATATVRLRMEREVLGQVISDTAGTTVMMRNKQ